MKNGNGKNSTVRPDNGPVPCIPLEDAILLRMLADHLGGRKTAISGEEARTADWDAIASNARRQQLAAIIYRQASELPSAYPECAPLAALQQDFAATAFQAANRRKTLAKIDEALTREGIPYILFKGTEVARYYPVPALRSMGDSDILVHECDKLRAHEALLSAGLEEDSRGANEWVYGKSGMEFELHHRLLYHYVTNSEQHKAYGDAAWEHSHLAGSETSRRELDWGFHAVFLFLHLRKHLLYSGVGFRQYLDLAALARANVVDWDRVAASLEGLGLSEFGCRCMAFCERWFGVESPWGPQEIDEAFYAQATRKIMGNGVFGFDDPENRNNHVLNEMHVRKGAAVKARVALRGLFPEYEDMCEADYYSFVRGSKWLLPAAWAYRFARSAVHGKASAGMQHAAAPLAMDEEMRAREQMLKGWGLG